MANFMLDLETLDVRPSAVVLSIGITAFDKDIIFDKFHITLDIDGQLAKGRTVSGSTLRWWLGQTDEARQAIIKEPTDVVTALAKTTDFIFENNNDGARAHVWGNGVAFDNVILGSLYDSFDLDRPWGYSGDRCYRTVRAMYKERYPNVSFEDTVPKELTAHNALDDAVRQTHILQAMWAHDAT